MLPQVGPELLRGLRRRAPLVEQNAASEVRGIVLVISCQSGHIAQLAPHVALPFGALCMGLCQKKPIVNSPFVQRGRERLLTREPEHLGPMHSKQSADLAGVGGASSRAEPAA